MNHHLSGVCPMNNRVEYDYYKTHPMEEISNWMTQVEKDHSDVVTIVDYGKTYEKRTIKLLKIGLKTDRKKKAVWMDCGIHAREWIAPAFCQYFVKQILQTYKTNTKMEEMMRNMDFYVTPVLNIDGYIYSWKDNTTRLWRKNRSPGPSSGCYGIDLNHNFDSNWDAVGVSLDCSATTYCRTQPMSEAQAVTFFVGTRKDDFLCFLTIHSYSQLILVPFGHLNFYASNYDELMEVGQGAADVIWKVHEQIYSVGSAPEILYPFSGSSQAQGIPMIYTFELRYNETFSFLLPEVQIQPTCEEAFSSALHIITYVHDKTFNGAIAVTGATLWSMLLAVGVNLM